MLAGDGLATLISALKAIKNDPPLPLFHLLLRSDSWWGLCYLRPPLDFTQGDRKKERERRFGFWYRMAGRKDRGNRKKVRVTDRCIGSREREKECTTNGEGKRRLLSERENY